jgi:hypothetical protein
MPHDLPLRCTCGRLRGVARGISASRGNRLLCYCGDCQSFAHFLGRADEILDANGGSDIFQMSPARLVIREGADQLACMRLTPKGLLRWYARCCRTPIGNTLATPNVPFVGWIQLHGDAGPDGRARDEALGPVRARVNVGSARGERSPLGSGGRSTLPVLLRFARIVLSALLRGDHKASPFFDPRTSAARAVPRILSEQELRDVEQARDAARPPSRIRD